jgi:hypothetical protein
MGVVIGADIGQKVDPTAIVVVEAEWREEPHFVARHLERLPLGTPYPRVVERIAAIVGNVARHSHERPRLWVDATGVGQPVVDLLPSDIAEIGAVYFTHGDRRTRERDGIRLGKAWLVSRLQALLQTGRLHLPKTAEAAALAKELLDYEIRVSEDANDRYGAFKVGAHDDLVTALGLAVQEEPTPSFEGQPRLDRSRIFGQPWGGKRLFGQNTPPLFLDRF